MGRAGLSMSLAFWSRHLDAIGAWLSLPGTVGYLCEPRDAQLYSRPNIESLWQSKRESHLKINVLWVETWTTKDKKWHFDFFSVSSQLSPLGFSQPSVSASVVFLLAYQSSAEQEVPVHMFQDWSHVYLQNSAGRCDKDSVWRRLELCFLGYSSPPLHDLKALIGLSLHQYVNVYLPK